MENIYSYGRNNREIVDLGTDEVFTDKEIREMYPDVYYQHVAPPLKDELDTDEVEAKTRDAREVEVKSPLDMATGIDPSLPDEEVERICENYPCLLSGELTPVEFYWRKWDRLVDEVADVNTRKKRGWMIGYKYRTINFAWNDIAELSELFGLEKPNKIIQQQVERDLVEEDDRGNYAMRRKYKRLIARCIEKGVAVSAFTLRYQAKSSAQ